MTPTKPKNKQVQDTSNCILIIEDSKIIQNMLKRTLTLTQYDTQSATNGKEALKAIKESNKKYKAIFLDILMPEMDGIETIQKIRALAGPNEDVTVIGVTGNHKRLSANDFKKLGFNAVVVKPVDCDILLTLLQRLSDPEADRWLGMISPIGRVEL